MFFSRDSISPLTTGPPPHEPPAPIYKSLWTAAWQPSRLACILWLRYLDFARAGAPRAHAKQRNHRSYACTHSPQYRKFSRVANQPSAKQRVRVSEETGKQPSKCAAAASARGQELQRADATLVAVPPTDHGAVCAALALRMQHTCARCARRRRRQQGARSWVRCAHSLCSAPGVNRPTVGSLLTAELTGALVS